MNIDILIIKKLSNTIDNDILIDQQKFYGKKTKTEEETPLLQLLDVVDIPDSKEIKNVINKSLIK